jgi:hypothetical protein
MIEKALVILPQPVVVLVVRRSEGRADREELRIAGTPVAQNSLLCLPSDWAHPATSRSAPAASCHQECEDDMCAPGVDPLKYLPMSTCVCTGGSLLGCGRSTVTTMPADL